MAKGDLMQLSHVRVSVKELVNVRRVSEDAKSQNVTTGQYTSLLLY